MALLLVRHAWAGDRSQWDGDDAERPLDDRGREQAHRLVDVLGTQPIDAIFTSPYRRCVETVEPLARARDIELELCPELGEERQDADGAALVRSLLGRNVVACGHGGLDGALLADRPKWKKGTVFVLDPEGRLFEVLWA